MGFEPAGIDPAFVVRWTMIGVFFGMAGAASMSRWGYLLFFVSGLAIGKAYQPWLKYFLK